MINYHLENKIATIEINNSSKYNCLSTELCSKLKDTIYKAYNERAYTIVIKAVAKNNVWSAGHDIRELPTDGSDPLAYDKPMEILLRTIQEVPIPVIACVDGTVWGGACDLCLSCDMIVASTTSTFAITPAKIGIPYNASGILHFINQLGMNKAREMFFTGNHITAEDALNVGLINHTSSSDKLDALLEEKFLNPIRANSIASISAIKRQFRILARASASISAENFEKIEAWRQMVYSGKDYLEGINSFLEKRPAKYTAAAKDLDSFCEAK